MGLIRNVLILALGCATPGLAVSFTGPPQVSGQGGNLTVSFTLSASTDVEVAVLDNSGKIVRHLAAGVLGGQYPPPAPLVQGLSQTLQWDGRDDFGNTASGGPFNMRVRHSIAPKFAFSVSTKNFPGTTYPSPFMARGELLESSHPIMPRITMHKPPNLDIQANDGTGDLFIKVWEYGPCNWNVFNGQTGVRKGIVSLPASIDRIYWGELCFSWDGKTVYHSTGLDDMHRFSLSAALSASHAGTMTGLYQGNQHSRGHATDPQGNLYVLHHKAHRSASDAGAPYEAVVSKLSPTGGMLRSQFIHYYEQSASGGIKVDKDGNIFVSARVKPAGREYPDALAGKISGTGAAGDLTWWAKEMYGSLAKYSNSGSKIWDYFGVSPTMRHGTYPRAAGCLCNVSRFDVDKFGRIFVSDAYRYSIIILDNNRNEILRYRYTDMVMDGRVPVAWLHQIEEADGMLYTADQFNNLVCGLRLESAESSSHVISRGMERERRRLPLLLENFPNPFLSKTTICINDKLPAGGFSMGIYDISGKLIKDLSGAINHRISWDGRDMNNRKVQSGVYVARLITGRGTAERRLLLVK
jgi:flagellar hook assembly protein FlgD